MKILYYAKHGAHDNEDEDAITHAFRRLGHEVTCVQETDGDNPDLTNGSDKFDFCLFHKVAAPRVSCPRVFWYFDLMEYDERECSAARANPRFQQLADTWFVRGENRRRWAAAVEPDCLVAFYTDGDWVSKDPAKRVHLTQGADERYAGYGKPTGEKFPPILFTGMRTHGVLRARNIEALETRYGGQFQSFGHNPRFRRHGRALADLFATTKIVIAPEGPSSDRYWSNRIYLTTGFGGMMLHPYCYELTKQYMSWKHWMYRSQDHLFTLIDEYLRSPHHREAIRVLQHYETMNRHTYRHRVEEMVRIVKERL